MKKKLYLILAGTIAGAVNGLLGAGGGMLLVPMLAFCALPEDQVFPTSVAIVVPICLVSLLISPGIQNLPWQEALPYLIAAIPGGLLSGFVGKKIPVKWLHRALGILILWGGIRCLCL